MAYHVYPTCMNFPNILTFIRIICVPVLVYLLLANYESHQLTAFLVFALAALTDSLDGFLARKKSQVTVIGQLLDPIADKLLVSSVLVCLVELSIVPAWMVVVIIAREIAVTGFRSAASSKGIHIPAHFLGKIKMNFEIYTIALLILGPAYLGRFYVVTQVGLYIVIVSAVLSAFYYFTKFGSRVILDNR